MNLLLILFLSATVCLQSNSEGQYCKDVPPFFSIDTDDQLQFGRIWPHVKNLNEVKELYPLIKQRRKEIHKIKSHWKEKIKSFEDQDFQENLKTLFLEGSLSSAKHGCGSAYFLYDENGNPKYVVKPFDEDILCLNNRKYFASPYNNYQFRVRQHIPLYRSAQAEILSYTIANILGFDHLIPKTHLAILESSEFYDIGDLVHEKKKQLFFEKAGHPDHEKLCSVQKFLPEIKNLYFVVEDWLQRDLSDKEILPLIDQEDFKKLVLLIWLLYDTDAHAGNIYAHKDERGIYHLIKIDNGLTFPNKNCHLLNALYFFPHAKLPLSKTLRNVIQNLPMEQIIEKMKFFEMEDALEALHERIETLKALSEKPLLSMQEIDMRLHALELPKGKNIALSDISFESLRSLLSYE